MVEYLRNTGGPWRPASGPLADPSTTVVGWGKGPPQFLTQTFKGPLMGLQQTIKGPLTVRQQHTDSSVVA